MVYAPINGDYRLNMPSACGGGELVFFKADAACIDLRAEFS